MLAALEMIYSDHLLPVLTKMPAGSEMRDAIASDEVHLVLHDNIDELKRAFELYAIEDYESDEAENVGDETKAMTCKQFGEFCSAAGFVGGQEVIRRFSVLNIGRKTSVVGEKANNVKVGVTQKDVRQIFAASQHDLDVSEEEHRAVSQNKEADHHQELMVFSEFLEGICRMGVLKYGSDESESKRKPSHYKCIKLAVERAISVVD